MYFDDEFLKSLPDDVPSAIMVIYDTFNDIIERLPTNDDKHTLIKEALGFIAAYSDAYSLNIGVPTITGNFQEDSNNINKMFGVLEEIYSRTIGQSEFEQYKSMFAAKLGKALHYEFSEGDFELIQNLINELRDLISETKELKDEHKQRLLRKLEKVQSELHKRVSDLDRFWGFCIDLSIVVGMMGENAKPATDLVKKIIDIIWPAQTRAYELSSSLPFKLLGQPADDKTKDNKS